MKAKTSQHLKIKLKGEDIDIFISALKKITDEQKLVGFEKTNLSEDEIKILISLSDKIKQ